MGVIKKAGVSTWISEYEPLNYDCYMRKLTT